jgi:GT2 family glycosyltransferase
MTEPEHDASNAVAIAFVHTDEVMYSWVHSLLQLLDHDLAGKARVWNGGWVSIRGGTDNLSYARNVAVRDFLKENRADWLFWCDTDMGFAADTIDRLMDAADPIERPVMGALCFANREVDDDGMGGRRALAAPVIMHWAQHGTEFGFDTQWDYPRDAVVKCDGVGSACVLIHRSVFERVAEAYGPKWYLRSVNPSTGELAGEDLSFCARLMSLGIPVHVHTGVKTTHAKRMWLAEEDYWRQRALNAPPPVAYEQKRDWTVQRYAIVPTHNRPERLLALVASLGEQCDKIVVLDNASEPPVDEEALKAAATDADVYVLRNPEQPPNLSRFWNTMFIHCEKLAEANQVDDAYDVAVFNDDSIVPAGWYDTVATALREHPTAVVAHTGDNPIREPYLLTDFNFPRSLRMAPHAFVVRGEVGLRSDESMRFWFFDDDFSRQAIKAGGVLGVPGPVVVNALATQSTVGELAEQTVRDRDTFVAKWGGLP